MGVILANIWFISAWVFVFFIIVVLVHFLCKLNKDRTMVGLGTEATILLILVTLVFSSFQMHATGQENRAKYLLDLKQAFFCDSWNNQKIIQAIEDNKLKITSEGQSMPSKNLFVEYDVDNYLINFDCMNIIKKKYMLDDIDIYKIFGWYIRSAWNNKAIRDYIFRIRKNEKNVYGEFEELAIKMNTIRNAETIH